MMEGTGSPNLNTLLGWNLPSGEAHPITHRQVVTWREYYRLSLNYPDRSDLYRMMVACQVARANAKTPAAVQVSQFRLTVGDGQPVTREQRDKIALAARDARIRARGGLDRYTIVDIEGNVIRPALVGPGSVGVPLMPNGCPNPMIRRANKEEYEAHARRVRAGRRTAGDARA